MNLLPEKTFFTSDIHFGHKNIIKYSNRPFANVDEMDATLISNWNSVVPKDGVVFSLGDFAFCKIGRIIEILSQLNGKVVMVGGNHDAEIWKNRKMLLDGYVEEITPYREVTVGNQFICMFHYGCRVWNKSHRGSWLLYGHSHNSLPPLGKSVDVGVDSTPILGYAAYKPFSFYEVKDFMDKQKGHEADHHTMRE